jgi:acetylornithine deacetylase/succinyl-diaminopimelate desuccinylase-like protein
MASTTRQTDIYLRPVEMLQHLIRFDTTNPPGNEIACVSYIEGLLSEAGIDTTIRARDPDRPNLIARVPGRGEAPPLLLQGHVDVVTTANQDWERPPFSGDLADGFVWGRGALDMKGGVAMMVSAMLRARAEGFVPAGDLLLAVLSDEEDGGDYGAKFLAAEHPELFDGVKYAIGEFGGFTLHLGGRRFYPIQMAEKQLCRMHAIVRGPGGHGSSPIRGGAMARLGKMLTTLNDNRLPVHITPVVEGMIRGLASALPQPLNTGVLGMLDLTTTDALIDQLGPMGRSLDALLHNTANPVIVRGGEKNNVHPSEIVVHLDGRLLPGFTPDVMVAELGALLGPEVELYVDRYDPYVLPMDDTLFGTLGGILRELDPEAVPIPYLLAGVTDGRHFANLGIQSYGFTPMLLEDGIELLSTTHAADERIPVKALEFGTEAMYRVVQRYGA